MLRWFLVIFLALMFLSWLSPLLRRMGFGRLPGDLRFRWLGRDWDVPLAERQARHQQLMARIREHDVHWWRRSFLQALQTAWE